MAAGGGIAQACLIHQVSTQQRRRVRLGMLTQARQRLGLDQAVRIDEGQPARTAVGSALIAGHREPGVVRIGDETQARISQCMPLHDLDSLIDDEHLHATGMIRTVTHPSEGAIRELGVPVKLSATPAATEQQPAPPLGQHSRQVLVEAGYTRQQIQALEASGATRCNEDSSA